MSDQVELEQLNASEASDHVPGMTDLRRLSDVPIDLTVEIGRTRLTVGETLARGEVVVIDEQFGVRITDVLGATSAPAAGAAPAAAAPGAQPAPPVVAPE
jgi:flagellar motor switch protein FliN/FliY